MVKLLKYLIIVPVRFYQYAISPITPMACRYTPTCSEYMIKAVEVHGIIKGTWLGLKRISTCHPWGGHGHDPVPRKKEVICCKDQEETESL